MSPFIRDGDVITIAPSGRKPKAPGCGIGQVVAFVSPVNERLVVHRIIGRHQSRFLIQGDNLPGPGADLIDRDDILGRVVRVERGGKRVWLGLGPERYVIAVLSRTGLLLPVRWRASALTRFLRRLRDDDN
ncbi:MAG: S26 family signal peptidase [candidate division WOR-3 bacterium]|nr:S26 family signal peptidase [candidate division WOR-3 bacterium]